MSESPKKGLMEQLVPLSKQQLSILTILFDRPTDENTPVNTVYYRAGQVSVLRMLKLHHEKMNGA